MGLCKCPKKKVTNLFCFEHRVNVCEHCLVSNHPKCIVQSYLQWLRDSDYDPTCRLCGKKLADEDAGECVRLVCYDVFHWSCLDQYCRQLPPNTAPAGYTCPICQSCVFPGNNVVSPVADALREKLTKVNWARTGLGLPLIEEPDIAPVKNTSLLAQSQALQSQDIPETHTHSNTGPGVSQIPPQLAALGIRQDGDGYPSKPTPSRDSVISMDTVSPYARSADKDFYAGHPANPRKLFDSTQGGDYLNQTHDHDEDKYKRRPALQWFARWFSTKTTAVDSRTPKGRKDPSSKYKRYCVILLLILLGFLTMIVIFSKLGRLSADSDPMLDPLANPNIKVNDAQMLADSDSLGKHNVQVN